MLEMQKLVLRAEYAAEAAMILTNENKMTKAIRKANQKSSKRFVRFHLFYLFAIAEFNSLFIDFSLLSEDNIC